MFEARLLLLISGFGPPGSWQLAVSDRRIDRGEGDSGERLQRAPREDCLHGGAH